MLFFRNRNHGKDRPVKYYPQVVTVGKPANTQEVARRIARNAVSPSDVHAVIRALPESDVANHERRPKREPRRAGLVPLRRRGGQNGGQRRKRSERRPLHRHTRALHPGARTQNLGTGYTRALVSDISFTEWKGRTRKKETEQEQARAGGSGGSENPLG